MSNWSWRGRAVSSQSPLRKAPCIRNARKTLREIKREIFLGKSFIFDLRTFKGRRSGWFALSGWLPPRRRKHRSCALRLRWPIWNYFVSGRTWKRARGRRWRWCQRETGPGNPAGNGDNNEMWGVVLHSPRLRPGPARLYLPYSCCFISINQTARRVQLRLVLFSRYGMPAVGFLFWGLLNNFNGHEVGELDLVVPLVPIEEQNDLTPLTPSHKVLISNSLIKWLRSLVISRPGYCRTSFNTKALPGNIIFYAKMY